MSFGKIPYYFLKVTCTCLVRDGPRIQMPASEWGQGIIPLKIDQHVLWSLLTTIWELAFQAYFMTYVRNVAAIWTCTQQCAPAVCNLSPWLAYVFAEAYVSWIVSMAFENGTPNAVPFSQYKEHFEKKQYKLYSFWLFFHYIFRQQHCNHRGKPSWVSLAPSGHLHIWKPLN